MLIRLFCSNRCTKLLYAVAITAHNDWVFEFPVCLYSQMTAGTRWILTSFSQKWWWFVYELSMKLNLVFEKKNPLIYHVSHFSVASLFCPPCHNQVDHTYFTPGLGGKFYSISPYQGLSVWETPAGTLTVTTPTQCKARNIIEMFRSQPEEDLFLDIALSNSKCTSLGLYFMLLNTSPQLQNNLVIRI